MLLWCSSSRPVPGDHVTTSSDVTFLATFSNLLLPLNLKCAFHSFPFKKQLLSEFHSCSSSSSSLSIADLFSRLCRRHKTFVKLSLNCVFSAHPSPSLIMLQPWILVKLSFQIHNETFEIQNVFDLRHYYILFWRFIRWVKRTLFRSNLFQQVACWKIKRRPSTLWMCSCCESLKKLKMFPTCFQSW